MLPAIGVDPEQRSGRGYIEARHVGRDLVGLEAEYRFAIWEFVGGVDRRSLSNTALDFALRPGGVAVYLNANEAF